MAVGCTNDDTNDGKGGNTAYNTKVNATAVVGTTWEEGDKIGIFTESDFNSEYTLVSGAGTIDGVFDGQRTKDAMLLGAYAPYSEAAGGNPSGIKIAVPTVVKYGETPVCEFATGIADDKGDLTFYEKLTRLNVSFANVEGSFAEGKDILALSITADLPYVGAFKTDITDSTAEVIAAEEASKVLEFTFDEGTAFSGDMVLKAGVAPIIKSGWKLKVSVRFGDITVDTVVNAESTMLSDEDFDLVLDVKAMAPGLDLLWAYHIGEYAIKANTPAIDDNGNVYINSSYDNNIYKINNKGQLVWKIAPGYDGTANSALSVEADGSAIYASGGGKGSEKTGLYVVNSEGTVVGSFLRDKFYANGGTQNIAINGHTAPSYDATHIYLGNGGTTGTAISLNKSDLSRIAYVSGSANGTGGPSGGCGSNIALSKAGTAMFHGGGYGAFIIDKNDWDNPANENTTEGFGKYTHFLQQVRHNNDGDWTCGQAAGVACGQINGVEHFFYSAQEKNSSSTFVAAVPADGSTKTPTFVHILPSGTQKQDQGGLIIGAQGEVIMSLKHNSTVAGGLYAVNGNGELAWRYESGTQVSGGAALDDAGNVHFADESGYYYIVKPDYTNKTATEVLKVNVSDILKGAGHNIDKNSAKSWTSVMLDKSGKIYLATNLNTDGSGNDAYILCMSYYTCKGVGKSSWPMKFGNQYHSGAQQ